MDSKDTVKQKTDIVTIIGEHVALSRAGKNFKARCPFHEERTPSFMVNPELQYFKCFGCGESGDVFTFLEKHEGMSFSEALQYLAERAGVTLQYKQGDNREKEAIYDLNKHAARFYHYLLLKHPYGERGLKYLTETRHLNPETIREFSLGATNTKRDILVNYLKKKGFKDDLIEKSGLAARGQGRMWDRFWGRVIFPIQDIRGRVIALSGRIIPEYDTGRVGKYVNSPETPIYHKSASLLGLHQSKDFIRKSRTAILFEGEFDFLSSWQIGVKNGVAVKGSAITDEQIGTLARYADKIVLALDSDFAGDQAAIKAFSKAYSHGLSVSVLELAQYKDPDEFAQAEPARYLKALDSATDIWEFLINVIFEREEGKTGASARISRQVVPLLAQINDSLVQAEYVGKVAGRLRLPVEVVAEAVGKARPETPGGSRENNFAAKVSTFVPERNRQEMLERKIIAQIINKPKKREIKSFGNEIETQFLKRIVVEMANFLEKKEWDLQEFTRTLPMELTEGFAELAMAEEEDELESLFTELMNLKRKNRKRELEREIRDAESMGLEETLPRLLREFNQLK